MADHIADAIAVTAGAELPHRLLAFSPVTASERAIERTRRSILRFLENVPDELSAMELRRRVEALEPSDFSSL